MTDLMLANARCQINLTLTLALTPSHYAVAVKHFHHNNKSALLRSFDAFYTVSATPRAVKTGHNSRSTSIPNVRSKTHQGKTPNL